MERLPRLFAGLVIAIAVGAAIGLAILWPGHVEPNVDASAVKDSQPAEVERVVEFPCAGLGTEVCRRVTVRLESGRGKGRQVPILVGARGIDPDVDVGDDVRVVKGLEFLGAQPGAQPRAGGEFAYSLVDFERRRPMLLLALAFVAVVLLLGRARGALSLVGLGCSLAMILVFVVPAILDGKPPLAVAIVGSIAVALITIVLAHGWGPKSVAAILGTTVSLLLTAGLAVLFTNLANLTGLSSEEALTLQLNSGNVDLQGLLLAGMVIGALGVLDDVTISQASTVLALRAASPALRLGELFARAMKVGRDHVTATVNTLVLAYAGASLPVLLLFSTGDLGFSDVVNTEIVAKEVVATLVGSIGLVAAVPITTALAALLSGRGRAIEAGR
jgi:uncharacterized membrane protein